MRNNSISFLIVNAGRVVKGVNFLELRDAGDPVEIAHRYDDEGADELTFLDITASSDAPIIWIFEEAASISANSSALKVIFTAPIFSNKR